MKTFYEIQEETQKERNKNFTKRQSLLVDIEQYARLALLMLFCLACIIGLGLLVKIPAIANFHF